MKEYISPEVEFVEFENEDIITASSCIAYTCPGDYGSTCTGNPYNGT